MTTTGLFPARAASNGGPRPVQRNAAERLLDRQVADALAEGLTRRQVAHSIGMTLTQVDASLRRICMRLGPQSTGTWRILKDGSVERG